MKHIYIFLCLCLLSAPSQAATFGTSKSGFGGYFLSIKGEIKRGDYMRMVRVIKVSGSMPKKVYLNSIGGDVFEAMKMGELLRKGLATTVLRPRQECLSSCFLIFVAGVNRIVNRLDPMHDLRTGIDHSSTVGLHRPYFDPSYFSGLTASAAEKRQEEAMHDVRRYLLRMNVSHALIDQMMRVPSYKMMRLDRRSFDAYVGKLSAGYEEWVVAQCGAFPSDEEREDYLHHTMMERETSDLLKDTLREEGYKVDFSKGYISYLKRTVQGHRDCKNKLTADERQKVFRQL